MFQKSNQASVIPSKSQAQGYGIPVQQFQQQPTHSPFSGNMMSNINSGITNQKPQGTAQPQGGMNIGFGKTSSFGQTSGFGTSSNVGGGFGTTSNVGNGFLNSQQN